MPELVPRWIVRDGERFEFKIARPGWLVYENKDAVILVGREEAMRLAEVKTTMLEERPRWPVTMIC